MIRRNKVAMIALLLLYSGSLSQAGEILISPQTGSRSKAGGGTTSNREKARAYQDEDVALPSSSIIIAPEEEGVLSPRGMGVPIDNRAKAREYIRDRDSGLPVVIITPSDSAPDGARSTRESLERNRDKARGYLDGGSETVSKPGTYVKIGTSVGVVGRDGVLIFDCGDTNNIAGRIGEGTVSGSEFFVVINGKKQKARCR